MNPQGWEAIEGLKYVHVYVNGSSMFQRIKRKWKEEVKKKSTLKTKIETLKEYVCDFWDLSKKSKKERKLMATN